MSGSRYKGDEEEENIDAENKQTNKPTPSMNAAHQWMGHRHLSPTVPSPTHHQSVSFLALRGRCACVFVCGSHSSCLSSSSSSPWSHPSPSPRHPVPGHSEPVSASTIFSSIRMDDSVVDEPQHPHFSSIWLDVSFCRFSSIRIDVSVMDEPKFFIYWMILACYDSVLDGPQNPPGFIHWMMIPACYDSAVDETQLV